MGTCVAEIVKPYGRPPAKISARPSKAADGLTFINGAMSVTDILCAQGWAMSQTQGPRLHPVNTRIAEKLRDMANVLEQQEEDGFRIRAYRRAADTVEAFAEPVDTILAHKGREGLVALPDVGVGIAAAIAEMLLTGRWAQLERLTGELEPEKLLRTIPSIGPKLAARLHEDLHIDTLEQLEMAAHDGRLEGAPGVGHRRAAAIRAYLADRLGRRRIRSSAASQQLEPPIELLLEIDAAYREKAAAGALRKIAPKRFNPHGEAWLPVLHQRRADWRFTALYSNTQRAHELGKTHDWVVIYFHTDASAEGQCTVVTAGQGELKGQRVVRGREAECAQYYARAQP